MNAIDRRPAAIANPQSSVAMPPATRPYEAVIGSGSFGARRGREFGVGYGSSSGYATARRYVPDQGPRLFRFC